MSGDTRCSGGDFQSESFYDLGESQRDDRSVHTGHTCSKDTFMFSSHLYRHPAHQLLGKIALKLNLTTPCLVQLFLSVEHTDIIMKGKSF